MASHTTETVSIEKDALADVFRDLNMMVVSLDRIGSCYADDPAGLERALTRFIIDWRITPRLAQARRLVGDAVLGPNPTPEEEEEFSGGRYWEPDD
jgi:hypothetical protein